MRLLIYGLQLLLDHMSVYLGGGDVCVSQHLLNGAQVSAIFQQMYREAVPQRMGRHVLADLRFRLIVLDDLPEPLTGSCEHRSC